MAKSIERSSAPETATTSVPSCARALYGANSCSGCDSLFCCSADAQSQTFSFQLEVSTYERLREEQDFGRSATEGPPRSSTSTTVSTVSASGKLVEWQHFIFDLVRPHAPPHCYTHAAQTGRFAYTMLHMNVNLNVTKDFVAARCSEYQVDDEHTATLLKLVANIYLTASAL